MHVRRFWSVLIGVVALAALCAGYSVPVGAQGGGLTEEELALIDRALQAREIYEGYASLVEQASGMTYSEMLITLGEQSFHFSNLATWERSSTVIRSDPRNITSTITVDVMRSGPGQGDEEQSTQYRVEAEIREVADVLYVQAAFESFLPLDFEIPSGWVVVESVDDWSAFQELMLEDFLEDTSPFDDADLVKSTATAVFVEQSTLEDGTPVDQILIVFDSAGIPALMAENTDNPTMTALLTALDEASTIEMVVTVDAEGNPREVSTSFLLSATGLSAQTIAGAEQLPAEATIDFTMGFMRSETYGQVNETFESVAAPEG